MKIIYYIFNANTSFPCIYLVPCPPGATIPGVYSFPASIPLTPMELFGTFGGPKTLQKR